MMSMAKVSRGSGFAGALKYNLGPKKQTTIIGGNMSSDDVKGLGMEFRAIANLRSDIKKPVWHQALRLPEGEVVSTEKLSEIADRYMQKMGLADHQYLLVEDKMKAGQHVHIIANRIGMDGRVYLGQNENLKSTQNIRDLEVEFGLSQYERPENGKQRAVAKPKKAEVEMALRTDEQPPKVQIQNIINQVLDGRAYSLSDFRAELEDLGVQSVATTNKNGLVGFKFALEDSDVWFKGSQLGKDFSKKRLVERGLHDGIENEASSTTTEQADFNTVENRGGKQATDSRDIAVETAKQPVNDAHERTANAERKADAGAGSHPAFSVGFIENLTKGYRKQPQRPSKRAEDLKGSSSESSSKKPEVGQDSLAYRFFTRDFVADAEFSHLVRFHDYKTHETQIDTGINKGTVKATDSRAIASSEHAEVNADLLIAYSKLRGWKTITTSSTNPEFLFHLEEQNLQRRDSLVINFTDQQRELIRDYEQSQEQGLEL